MVCEWLRENICKTMPVSRVPYNKTICISGTKMRGFEVDRMELLEEGKWVVKRKVCFNKVKVPFSEKCSMSVAIESRTNGQMIFSAIPLQLD